MGDGRVEGEGETDFTGDVMHLLAAMLEVQSELMLVRICRGSITLSWTQTVPPTIEHHPPLHHP